MQLHRILRRIFPGFIFVFLTSAHASLDHSDNCEGLLGINGGVAVQLIVNHLGFESRVAQALALSPEFMQEFKSGLLAQKNNRKVLRGLKAVTVYRGVRLEKSSDFDPDYNLFVGSDGAPPAAAIYVAGDYEMAAGYSLPHDDKPVSILVSVQVPKRFLHPGRLEGSFRIWADDLKKIGFTSIMPFVVSTELCNQN